MDRPFPTVWSFGSKRARSATRPRSRQSDLIPPNQIPKFLTIRDCFAVLEPFTGKFFTYAQRQKVTIRASLIGHLIPTWIGIVESRSYPRDNWTWLFQGLFRNLARRATRPIARSGARTEHSHRRWDAPRRPPPLRGPSRDRGQAAKTHPKRGYPTDPPVRRKTG